MQTKNDLERHYEREDPWCVQGNKEDWSRKKILCYIAEIFAPIYNGLPTYESAIDIGCGEGWVTRGLPAKFLYGVELSDNAASRFPESVHRVTAIDRAYDLVCSFGTLYRQYQWENIVAMMRAAAQPGGIVMVSYIAQWEVPEAIDALSKGWTQVFQAEFPYEAPGPNHSQRVRVWRVSL